MLSFLFFVVVISYAIIYCGTSRLPSFIKLCYVLTFMLSFLKIFIFQRECLIRFVGLSLSCMDRSRPVEEPLFGLDFFAWIFDCTYFSYAFEKAWHKYLTQLAASTSKVSIWSVGMVWQTWSGTLSLRKPPILPLFTCRAMEIISLSVVWIWEPDASKGSG